MLLSWQHMEVDPHMSHTRVTSRHVYLSLSTRPTAHKHKRSQQRLILRHLNSHEWEPNENRMSHVTNENRMSRSHIRISHEWDSNESLTNKQKRSHSSASSSGTLKRNKWDTSRMRISRVINVRHDTNRSHIWMSHVAHEWVMSHMQESCHIYMSHVTYMKKSRHE